MDGFGYLLMINDLSIDTAVHAQASCLYLLNTVKYFGYCQYIYPNRIKNPGIIYAIHHPNIDTYITPHSIPLHTPYSQVINSFLPRLPIPPLLILLASRQHLQMSRLGRKILLRFGRVARCYFLFISLATITPH